MFGQMAFFIEFLTATALFERWVEDCPLQYKSPNGSSRRDILGTWLLSILSGHLALRPCEIRFLVSLNCFLG